VTTRVRLIGSALAAPLLLAGCSGQDKPTSTTTAVASAKPSAPAIAGQRLAGTGVAVTIPTTWTKVDPATDSSDLVTAAYGLKDNPAADILKEVLQKLKANGAVWALDPTTASGGGPATNLQAACDSGGLTGSSLEALRTKAQALHKGVKITDVTVSGKPALRISYTETASLTGVTTETIDTRVPVAGDKYCYLDLTGKPGSLAAVADPIIAKFAVT